MNKQTEIFVQLQQKWIELNNLKDGDKVKVTGVSLTEGEGGWLGERGASSFSKVRGLVGTINDSFSNRMDLGINVWFQFEMLLLALPYFVLEKVVDKPKPVSKPKREPKEKKTFHIGQRFIIEGDEYILSCSSKMMAVLIGLIGGNRWNDAVVVANTSRITQDEMDRISDGASHEDLILVK